VRYGSDSSLGALVTLSLANGLAPRHGAFDDRWTGGFCTRGELGIQRNSEQIDALETMA